MVYKQPSWLNYDEEIRISKRCYFKIIIKYKWYYFKITLHSLMMDLNRTRNGRVKFSIRTFAAKYNLGAPIAGNLFQAQYDDYVPILREQLSQEP